MATVAPMLIMAVASYALSQASKPSLPSMPEPIKLPPPPEPVKVAPEATPATETTSPLDIASQRRKAISANAMYAKGNILGIGEDDTPQIDITKAIKLGI
jgi:hypothetical protein